MKTFLRSLIPGFLIIVGLNPVNEILAQASPAGDADRGRLFFQQGCAICHATTLGPGNSVIVKQGPDLIGVVGRHAGTGLSFNYTKALKAYGVTWDATTLDQFLTSPMTVVPGTTMPIPLADPENRRIIIAYLSTLILPDGVSPTPATSSLSQGDPNDWQHAAPGVRHHITVADLPPPYSTTSSGNGPQVVDQPANASLSVPPGFTVQLFASGLSGPRLMRVAPNGDIFIAETRENRIRVMRAADGATAPSENQIYAEGLDRPFGIAFYPPGNNPQWIYVANNDSVVRFPYSSGDLTASGAAQVIVPRLCPSPGGGHSTRDVAFSPDGTRMFISAGSASNVAEGMSKKTVAEAQAWEAQHGFGAAWDSEENRADILVTDPEGHQPLHTFATGIRNGVGMAVNPVTGDLWVSTNERDALGDNLVPDYITRVKEGGFYGWPWYYMGSHEDPRHAGERPDLAGRVTVPDVLLQSHSASLEVTFYTATNGVAAFPAEYRGDAFAAEHGSWNRSSRTGYKIIRVRLVEGVPTGEYDDFLTGFVVDNRSVWGRPVGVAVAHDGALLVTEDGNGTLWRIAYTGH
jgi:glucose/arabinose dehydrogenase/cytochrome c2